MNLNKYQEPKIRKRGLVWFCEGAAHFGYENAHIFGLGISPDESYKDFLVKIDVWKHSLVSHRFYLPQSTAYCTKED